MTYSKVKTFNIDGCKVRVHFPDLPEEERAKRKNALMKAAERFLKHAERVKKEKAEQENMPEPIVQTCNTRNGNCCYSQNMYPYHHFHLLNFYKVIFL